METAMLDAFTVLSYTGVTIGGIVAGIIGAKKLPKKINGYEDGYKGLEKSEKTGGALRISEEGLGKFSELKKTVEEKYLTDDKHSLVCGKTRAEMMLYISKQLEIHTDKIVAEINDLYGKKSPER